MLDNLSLNFADYIPLIVGVLIPALVALVTKQVASSRLKSFTLIGLAALSSVLAPLTGDSTLDLQSFVNNFAVTFGTAILAYYGFYKPAGVTESIQTAVPGGFGSAPELPDPGNDPDEIFELDPSELPDPGAE